VFLGDQRLEVFTKYFISENKKRWEARFSIGGSETGLNGKHY